MLFQCEKCGHEQDSLPVVHVSPIKDWQNYVSEELAAKLSISINIMEDDDKHAILYLSTEYRETLMATILDPQYNRKTKLEHIFSEKFPHILDVINKNFNIVGTCNPPSYTPGAIIDLTNPMFLFCFVIVEKDENFQNKIDELGLDCLTHKEAYGMTNTLAQLE